MTSVNRYRGDECQSKPRLRRDEIERIETNIDIGAQSEIDRKDQEKSETQSRDRDEQGEDRNQEGSEKRCFTVRNIFTKENFQDKSMLKHIMRKCKIVNYVDKETSSGKQISSRRRSLRTTPARLHRNCTVVRRNTNLDELTKNNTADLFTKHRNGLRTQSLARKLERRILDGANDND